VGRLRFVFYEDVQLLLLGVAEGSAPVVDEFVDWIPAHLLSADPACVADTTLDHTGLGYAVLAVSKHHVAVGNYTDTALAVVGALFPHSFV